MITIRTLVQIKLQKKKVKSEIPVVFVDCNVECNPNLGDNGRVGRVRHWISSLNLTFRDKFALRQNGNWLSDRHMTVANLIASINNVLFIGR